MVVICQKNPKKYFCKCGNFYFLYIIIFFEIKKLKKQGTKASTKNKKGQE